MAKRKRKPVKIKTQSFGRHGQTNNISKGHRDGSAGYKHFNWHATTPTTIQVTRGPRPTANGSIGKRGGT